MPNNTTIVTTISPSRLSKGYALDANGTLKKMPGGSLIKGNIEIASVSTLHGLADLLVNLSPKQALTYGIPANAGASKIVTKSAFETAGRPEAWTPRTNAAFVWPAGPGVMMLDYDAPAAGEPLGRDELVQAICRAAPALADCAMLWWPSASSCIYAGDTDLTGIRGQRLYMLVKDPADIERAGAVLVHRLWLAGHGRFEISKSGSLLERTLIDATVWQPSRLDFAGGADCGAGLEQRRGSPVMTAGDAGFIDTASVLPDLTPAEQAALGAIRLAKRNDEGVQAEAHIAKKAWIADCVGEIVSSLAGNDDACKQAIAEATARRALQHGELGGHYRLQVIVGGQTLELSVSDVLSDRERFHGCKTLDPIEPEYDCGRAVGCLYLMQARPTLFSFARGGNTYKLHRAPERLELIKGRVADAAEATVGLLREDPIVFDFGGQLAMAAYGQIMPMCEHLLANHLPTLAQYWSSQRRGDEQVMVDRDPPSAMLKQIIAKGELRRLKALDAIITGPTVRLDGTVLARPGYDAGLRLVLDPKGQTIPAIPETPSIDQAGQALDTLLLAFKDFPFVNNSARGALLSALLTAAVRGILPTSPAFAFDAPVQGSGKTLLALCVGALMTGRAPDVWPHTAGRDDEETRKRLFTALRDGAGALVWDNVVGTFDSAAMAGFLTASVMADRILGKSEAARIPNRAILLITGNNLSLAGDLPRRVIVCRIDPASATPFDRSFTLNPLNHVLSNRMALLAAACTLIRARFIHWSKLAPGKLASFEDWDTLVRQTVCFADQAILPGAFGDPMELVKEAQAAEPEAETLAALLDAIERAFQTREFSAREVQDEVVQHFNLDLGRALKDIAGDKVTESARSIGRVRQFRDGRIANSMRLKSRMDSAAGARKFRLEFV
jgi:hypothetical protein